LLWAAASCCSSVSVTADCRAPRRQDYFAGSLICAERTSEHQLLYEEGFEAVFWDSAEECSLICRDLLAHPLKREWIRLAGSSRVRELGVGNEDISRNILNAI
jgi:hypothetical protein